MRTMRSLVCILAVALLATVALAHEREGCKGDCKVCELKSECACKGQVEDCKTDCRVCEQKCEDELKKEAECACKGQVEDCKGDCKDCEADCKHAPAEKDEPCNEPCNEVDDEYASPCEKCTLDCSKAGGSDTPEFGAKRKPAAK